MGAWAGRHIELQRNSKTFLVFFCSQNDPSNRRTLFKRGKFKVFSRGWDESKNIFPQKREKNIPAKVIPMPC